ncbi:MAG: phosphatase PAP2 family protein [Bacteroidota bacterium]
MTDIIRELDKAFFFTINGFHFEWLDYVMKYISWPKTWFPFYVLLAWFLHRRLGQKAWTIILALIILVVATDQGANIIKKLVERPRPCHEHDFALYIHLVDPCGGAYGFVSNHAANCFAMVTFIWLLLRRRSNLPGFLLIWAIIVSFSRIYLGQHYPSDIAGGALFGIICAVIMRIAYGYIAKRAEGNLRTWMFGARAVY